ncbi:MAG: undecaprenyl-diphosphate phosphatase [Elusimicrobiota bacterium]|nr:undecaprenyl-diphosphate phosphatase [Endomicrobiia bacterium]MDW8165467.1 undecaprenyl-diphosphate phosphatase [Elusimicrobiota bacterium]
MEIQVLILGLIQGAIEFLPVSSSGHLVLFQKIFGFKEMLFYDVILHFSTLIAVVVLFFKEILTYIKNSRIILNIIILSIPTGIIGLLVKKYFYGVYDNVLLSGFFLFITGVWLIFSERVYLSKSYEKLDIDKIDIMKAFLIGVAQGFAVLPGISRSGFMLGSMLLLNVQKEQSTKFVFIASIPSILGATFIEILDIMEKEIVFLSGYYLLGAIMAFFVGLLSLKFLVVVVKKQKLRYFGYYCFLVGFISFLVFLKVR